MLITFERKVPQSSYTSQNDHKSKGYPSKTLAFTMQKSDRGARIFFNIMMSVQFCTLVMFFVTKTKILHFWCKKI